MHINWSVNNIPGKQTSLRINTAIAFLLCFSVSCCTPTVTVCNNLPLSLPILHCLDSSSSQLKTHMSGISNILLTYFQFFVVTNTCTYLFTYCQISYQQLISSAQIHTWDSIKITSWLQLSENKASPVKRHSADLGLNVSCLNLSKYPLKRFWGQVKLLNDTLGAEHRAYEDVHQQRCIDVGLATESILTFHYDKLLAQLTNTWHTGIFQSDPAHNWCLHIFQKPITYYINSTSDRFCMCNENIN